MSDVIARVAVILGAIIVVGGCIEPDLGQVPFFCNNGDPRCPEGYSCVADRCVRGGELPKDSAAGPDRGDGPSGPDWLMPWPEASTSDLPVTPDGPPVKWDLGPLPDAPKPKTDGWPPHLGCQAHSECDSSNPCCCPTPFIPQIWSCLPLCLNPFCI